MDFGRDSLLRMISAEVEEIGKVLEGKLGYYNMSFEIWHYWIVKQSGIFMLYISPFIYI